VTAVLAGVSLRQVARRARHLVHIPAATELSPR